MEILQNTPRRAIVRTAFEALSFYGPQPASVITITGSEMAALAGGGVLTISVAGNTFVVEAAELSAE
jgi:hypothetical protein